MAERRLVVLRYEGKTPAFAECARCHLKFFTPRELSKEPMRAEENLRHKFEMHECKDLANQGPLLRLPRKSG